MSKTRDATAMADIKIRMREPLRADIERAARDKGISMNAEMLERLGRAALGQSLLRQSWEIAYGGSVNAEILAIVGEMIVAADQAARMRKTAGWLDDRRTFDQLVEALDELLGALKPEEVVASGTSGSSTDPSYLFIRLPIMKRVSPPNLAEGKFENPLSKFAQQIRERFHKDAGIAS
jgi:hypothetical protein